MKRNLVILGIVFMLISTAICVPTGFTGALEEIPESEDVGLPNDGFYKITSFDGDKTFGVEWSEADPAGKEYDEVFCKASYEFVCVDGYDVKPAPVGRYCVKVGNQKLDCDLAIPGVQKAGNFQEIRWVVTELPVRCYSFLPSLRKCPPCPDCYDPWGVK